MKELKYYKNSKFEIVFENLDEIKDNDNVVLRLKDGDIRPLALINNENKKINVYIPCLTEQGIDCLETSACCFRFGEQVAKYFIFDANFRHNKYLQNLDPKWNVSEDSAVVFLSDEDSIRYDSICGKINSQDGTCIIYDYDEDVSKDLSYMIGSYKLISIIIPELHAEDESSKYHIENVNKVCEELKEQYGIERIELFVSHCFVKFENLSYNGVKLAIAKKFDIDNFNFDKITTTNSTGILEVRDAETLTVIDCVEFFINKS